MSNKTEDEFLQSYAKDYQREVVKLNKENETRVAAWEAWERDTGLKPPREQFERMVGGQPMTVAEISSKATERAQAKAKQQRELDALPLEASKPADKREAAPSDQDRDEQKQTRREALKEHMRQQRERNAGRTRSRPR